ncbi:DUF4019 domain-containing protein [Caballeronia sp. LjRoot34]|uniref:DUF4019 domain-containing protein n=1 Tax=Caballeronia sp. LjRoot34 TaxID=3342325 RepID=UPI003ECFAC70
MSIGRIICCACLTLVVSLASAKASDDRTPDAQQSALHAISEFANDMCNRLPETGSQQNIALDANGQAQLARLLKLVGDLGFSGGVKYSRSDYNGLLQADLSKALHDAQECRLEIFRSLKDKLLAGPSNTAREKATPSSSQTTWRKPSESPNSFAMHWLSYVDDGKWDKAYAELASETKDSYSEREFADLLASKRSPRGRVLSRTFVGVQPAERQATTPSNVKGMGVLYNTIFEHSSGATVEPGELLLLIVSPEGVYRVGAYNCLTC